MALVNIRLLLSATPKTCVLSNRNLVFEVITVSGFGRDRDTILAIWRRHVPYVVGFVFVEFVDT